MPEDHAVHYRGIVEVAHEQDDGPPPDSCTVCDESPVVQGLDAEPRNAKVALAGGGFLCATCLRLAEAGDAPALAARVTVVDLADEVATTVINAVRSAR